jgi:hypothetical protein
MISCAESNLGEASPPHERCVEDQPETQQQPGIAVRFEASQAITGVVDLEAQDLPGEVRGDERQGDVGELAGVDHIGRGKPQAEREAVEPG